MFSIEGCNLYQKQPWFACGDTIKHIQYIVVFVIEILKHEIREVLHQNGAERPPTDVQQSEHNLFMQKLFASRHSLQSTDQKNGLRQCQTNTKWDFIQNVYSNSKCIPKWAQICKPSLDLSSLWKTNIANGVAHCVLRIYIQNANKTMSSPCTKIKWHWMFLIGLRSCRKAYV